MVYKKLSEYQCKKLYYLHKPYFVDFLHLGKLELENVEANEKLVIKVDNGTKHRMNRGLVQLNKTPEQCIEWIKERNTQEKYIVEKPMAFDKELYVLIRCGDDHDEILVHQDGGVALDNPEEGAQSFKIPLSSDTFPVLENVAPKLQTFLEESYAFFKHYHLVFMEMNPVVEVGDKYMPLDFAVLMDSDANYLFSGQEKEILEMDYYEDELLNRTEQNIKELDEKTGGSLKFTLINPEGNVWTLVAGGGASVVYTDAIIQRGYLNELANYGEYSGDPQEELVELYCCEVFSAMSNVKKPKTLFIGGGIANFTDVASTFKGMIKAIHKHKEVFQDTEVWVRRGGPNYQVALENLANVFKTYDVKHHIFGPDQPITEIVSLGLSKKESPQSSECSTQNLDHLVPPAPKEVDSTFLETSAAMVYGFQKKAIQRMLDFDYMCGKSEPSVKCVVELRSSREKQEPFFWGNKVILLPLYNTLGDSLKHNYDVVVSFASYRASFDVIQKIMGLEKVKKVVVIAEGIPERFARILRLRALETGKLLIGPATVGGIKPGVFRIANTGGSMDNLMQSGLLHSGGSVAMVTRSGGLLNELCKIVHDNSDGVYQAISIGGDRWPGSHFLDYIYDYEADPNVKLIVLLGEIGGVQEIYIANAIKKGLIKKPVIGWCMGIAASYLSENIQFGHAGASANASYESAVFKNQYMRENGILVPDTFELLPQFIQETFSKLMPDYRPCERVYEYQIKENRKMPDFFSSISNELGEELHYNDVPISVIVEKGLGSTIGHLWLKQDVPQWFAQYIELILKITADHGAMVSGAQNTIIASRAGKDLVSSLCAGLLTIGDYFGGALNQCAKQFMNAHVQKQSPLDFVETMNKEKQIISGIGHKIKTKENPDKRVEILKDFVYSQFPSTKYTDFAFEVEALTLQKRNNLILNVDGFIANSMLDAFSELKSEKEMKHIIDNDFMNAFFVLGRTIGFIGHWYDQKRLQQGLYRCKEDNVSYIK